MAKPVTPSSSDKQVHTAQSFWQWFADNQHRFDQRDLSNAQKAQEGLSEIIGELKKFDPWFKALIGQLDDNTSELIITADGDIALFVKVEQLVAAAPQLPGWLITPHKPALGFGEISIEMFDKKFDDDTIKFYPLTDPAYPDQVSIVFTHKDFDEVNAVDYQTAGSIYIQNSLGELNTAIQIDDYRIGPEPEDTSVLIPVTKLQDYLIWREKEFVEKYDQTAVEYPEEFFNMIEGQDAEENIMLATVNPGYEHWEYKPIYCWSVRIEIEYEGISNGLPDNETLKLLQDVQSVADTLLTADPGIVYVGSKTYKGCRSLYFYAKNYRDPSLLLYDFCSNLPDTIKASFFIEKDKYWQSVADFFNAEEEEEEEE
jgi:hypothetical protein